ncbi:MAG: copper-translocating P-type ATPase [Anaerolineales bacterium]|nr:copper-translocating P-type ATPase [Anaerolineales bacterium]
MSPDHTHDKPSPGEVEGDNQPARQDKHAAENSHKAHHGDGSHNQEPRDHTNHEDHHDRRAAEGGDHDHHQGHGDHVDHSGHEEMFRKRFWVCLILSIPVLLFSETIQQWLGFSMPVFPGSGLIVPVFSIIVFIYGGGPFLSMALPEIRNRKPGMMTLISLAISVAFFYSMAVVLFLPGEPFFWELVTLVTIMLLGHWLEMRSVRQASGALQELARLMPDTAERLRDDGDTEEVPLDKIKNGDLLLVRPGASIPADGEVERGESDVNEAMITGESLPVKKAPGDSVIGGTINGDGSLRVRVTKTGDETTLAGIMRLVDQAQQSKSRTQILADKAAGWLFYIALLVATITAIVWTGLQGMDTFVVARVATVLVIACPHALGLAVPLVVAITTSMGANNGILVRDRLALEQARDLNTVIFDKTGTLTRGEFGVVGVETVDGWDRDKALALATAVEGDSEHTIARGFKTTAEERELPLPEVSGFEAIKGRGVQANYNGQNVYVGGPRLLEMLELQLPDKIANFEREAANKGQSVVTLIQNGQVVAGFALADVIRPESKEVVERLHEMGIEVAMLTGDSEAVAKAVAQELGIDIYFAQVLPEHKDQKVAKLQQQGKRVAMVGDGVNDAPALTRADVGIAIGSGTDVAIESAGIILVKNNPLDAVKIISLSRASYRKMIENLVWATGYNVFALPLAAGVLAPIGIILSPAVGAVLMSASTVIVAINAQFLRRLKLAN